MDCGPASLQCFLAGAGLAVSYPRLREACATDVDGTSINTLEEVAVRLGAAAEQVVVPVDHLFEPETNAFPAIAVVLQPEGATHFVVLWRKLGSLVQVMDPGSGRRWLSLEQLRRELYVHESRVPAEAWREWAASDEFLEPLRRRVRAVVGGAAAEAFVREALADETWRGLGTLDAASRLVSELLASGALAKGEAAAGILKSFIEHPDRLPRSGWLAREAPEAEDELVFRGAVLLRTASSQAEAPSAEVGTLPETLAAALNESAPGLSRQLLALLQTERRLGWLLGLAVLLGGGAVVVEAFLLRTLVDVGRWLPLRWERVSALASVLVFMAGLLALELSTGLGVRRLGRVLEVRLRIAFLEKLPRLADRFFRTRLASDLAERAHQVDSIRHVPDIAASAVRLVVQVLATAAAIVWMDPALLLPTLLGALFACAIPLGAWPVLAERDLRVRGHLAALGKFHLDALLGLVALKAHGGERALLREQEGALVGWRRASASLLRAVVGLEALHSLIGFGTAAWLVALELGRGRSAGGMLLVAYWALNLPLLGQSLLIVVRTAFTARNTALRLFEPLTTAVSPPTPEAKPDVPQVPERGVRVELSGVAVEGAGRTILEEINLHVDAGEHVAIVGRSGAGKSSLVGLLLGFHTTAAGELRIDGQPLGGDTLEALRRRTAWVDPQVQLWNRTLLANLLYGTSDGGMDVGLSVEEAELSKLVAQLPEGLQTRLGEGGGLVSGGEGQRVRFGRALLRDDARLVILDEPFRGLDRTTRGLLLGRARRHWSDATLLCITHDIRETLSFPRVLVVEEGRVVEDGTPGELASRQSRFAELLAAEDAVRATLGEDARWRRWRIEQGTLREDEDEEAAA